MISFFGDYDTTETVVLPFNAFSSDDPSASVTITNLLASDVEIHKDGGTTQRSSDAGVTVSIDFDTITGNHLISIDLSDNTDAGFYAAGSRYQVRIEGSTIDGGTINAWVGSFSIGCVLRPTADGRKLDVTTTGAGGIDWANVENPTTAVDLSATDIQLADTVTTLTGHTAQTADHTAGIADIPTVAEFEARTIVSADYVVTSDTIAGVTLVDTTTDVTNQVTADATAISGDTTAADNLESQYDTTGLSGDTFPSTQSQIGNITNVGSAVNTPAESYSLTTGTQSANLYTDTKSLDGTRHTHTDTAGEMVLEYVFSVGAGSPSGVTITGALIGNNDNLEVLAYDYVAAGYIQIGVLVGKVSNANEVNNYDVFTSMVGTGASLGEVKIKLQDGAYTLTTATLYIDQVYVSFSNASSGYELGSIWVDDSVTNTGTTIGVDGVATNPVSTWAAALTLSASTNLNKFQIANGTSITLSANSDNFSLFGFGWTLALSGQSIEGAYFEGAMVTGIATSTVTSPKFKECRLGAVTLPPCGLQTCGIGMASGQFTAGSDGQYIIVDGFSLVPGSGSPAFVFTGLGAATGINNRGWKGGTTYTLDSDCTLSHEVLAGGGTTVTTGGGDAEIRGITRSLTIAMSAAETVQFNGVTGPIALSGTTTATVNLYGVAGVVTDTTSAATVTNHTVSQENVNIECDTALADYDGPTNAEMEARTPTAAQLAYIVSNAATGLPVTFTTAGGSTTAAVINEIDGAAGSATNDQYNGRLLVFIDGTLKGVVTDITDYVGATTTATITAIPFAPTNSHNARLI